ncbi:MAG: TetR/AcrR family transcriptional regulator [Rivularia sp. (in: cyanobacteria)]
MKRSNNSGNPQQQIIIAAYDILSSKGYQATTMKEVAKGAGVAPGLIHYYFDNKEQLMQAVLWEAADRYIKNAEKISASIPPEQLNEEAFNWPKERVESEPQWYRLRYELFALGLHNPNLRESMNKLLAKSRNAIAFVLHQISSDKIANREALASILLASFDGLALQKLADPNFDLENAYAVLKQMFQSQLSED